MIICFKNNYEPISFNSVDSLLKIIPKGGGGTNFHAVFDYVNKNLKDNLPACIIILTDGDAPFPDESYANGIPVLWLINNNSINPPWGKVARLK